MDLILKKPDGSAGSAAPAIIIGIFVSFGGVLFGYDTGTIGGILAMQHWRDLFSTGYVNPKDHKLDVSPSQSAEIVSILSAGTFFGALLSAPVADFVGRRLAMIFNTFVFTFGVILQTIATSIPLFVAGRFFAGLGVGLLSATIPLYQSETAPKWIRGTIVGCYQLAITFGLLLAAIVNESTKDRTDTGSYRIPIGVQFAFSIILVVGMLILPETPRFLVKNGDHDKAAKSLSRLRRLDVDHPAIIDELAEIRANHAYEMSIGTASYFECFRPPLVKRLLTGCVLQALQQLSGVNFIFYYGTQYFQNSGIKNAFVISMITGAVNVASTFPGLWMVEKWGRRPLLLFGSIGMTISQFIVAITGTASDSSNQTAQQAAIAFVCIYIFFFASSWGPVAWVVTGEIFPLKARAKCLSITTASNWLLNWAIAYSTPYLVNPGPGNANLQSKVFFIWGSFCAIGIFFVFALIYETKGLSLEQVDELYSKVSAAWRSKGFVPTISFQDVQDAQHEGVRKASLAEFEEYAVRRKSAAHGVHEQKQEVVYGQA